MTIKLDILKAYDKIELSFFELMMRKLGFNEVWISRTMACVTAVTY